MTAIRREQPGTRGPLSRLSFLFAYQVVAFKASSGKPSEKQRQLACCICFDGGSPVTKSRKGNAQEPDSCTLNYRICPLDKMVELQERMIQDKNEMIDKLQRMIADKM